MSGYFRDSITDRAGNALSGAMVEVRAYGLMDLASISSRQAGVIAPAPNPMPVNDWAEIEFFADPGVYTLTIYHGGKVYSRDVGVFGLEPGGMGLSPAQALASAFGLAALAPDENYGYKLIDHNAAALSGDTLAIGTAPDLGDTLGGALAALNDAVREVSGTANQIIVTLDTGTAVFSLPQNIHTDASPSFATVNLKKLKGRSAAPAIVVGAGAGAGATLNQAFGSDICFRVDITTGAAPPAASSTLFEATFSEAYPAGQPPMCILIPANKRAWDGQNTAAKAVDVDLANTTASKLVVRTGTSAMAASSSYSYYVIVFSR